MVKQLIRMALPTRAALTQAKLLRASSAQYKVVHYSTALKSDIPSSQVPPAALQGKVKPLSEMPSVGMWKGLYWLFLRGYLTKIHEAQLIAKKKIGPLWMSSFSGYTFVNVADTALIEKVLRQEGKYPIRNRGLEWGEYRVLRGYSFGPLLQEGEDWYRIRKVLNQRMLKPQEAKLYDRAINEVVSDLVQRFYWLRETKGSGVMVYDLTDELYRFAFEGIASILFEMRLGCLKHDIPKETQQFIDSVASMFYNTMLISALPKWTRSFLPFWKRCIQAWDTMFEFAGKAIDKKLADIQDRLDKGESVEGEYLTHLISSGQLGQSEIYSSVTELLLAGVDTTSNTLSWALYHLARSPEVQNTLYQEIVSVVPGEQVPTAQDVDKMPFLKAVIKEVLRMYPVLPSVACELDTDIILQDYFIPRQQMIILYYYANSMDENEFPEPQSFRPERWIRGKSPTKHHPFSSIPFGYGVRSCIGRRIAELEMYLVITRVLKHFELRPDPQGTEIHPKVRIIMIPGAPLNLQLLDRKQ
ncbi:sterol 26-hydroxylase, mitochondrial-like isoform X1 [Latimeria chalumnae]|uniref:sterol 26-hydroxylase, mitochondrial-like isoform X1 n=1 Tax=Latimeria chalumnae TaxID=7897 RepID=UPI00313A97DD